jgi:MATE family, multidrug efflux pump
VTGREWAPSEAEPVTPQREWHRRVWRLAGPLILSNLSAPLMGAVDTAVMGHLPAAAYIGAVALAATVFNFLYWGLGFLRMGTTGFTAQAFGARDALEIRAALLRPLLLAGLLGLLLIALQAPIGRLAFRLLDGGPEVTALAGTYYAIRIWGAPAALANYALWGWLLGVQRARETLFLQILLNGVNIALALLFVVGLGWRIAGVAAATLVSEWLAATIGLALALNAARGFRGALRLTRTRIFAQSALLALIRANANIFLRTLCIIFAFAYFTSRSARMGDLVLAANSVLFQFQLMMSYGLDGFANAAAAFVGSAIGAASPREFQDAVRVTTLWAAALAGLATLVYALFGPALIGLLTSQPEVRTMAELYLPWMIASPLVSFWCFQLDGVFFGATSTAEMRNAMVLALAAYLAASALLIPFWGNHGLWLSLLVLMAARGLALGGYYPRLERRVAAARQAS